MGDDIIYYDNYILNKKEKIRYYLITSVFIFFLGLIFYGKILYSLVLIPISIPLKKYYIRYLLSKRKNELRNGFKDFLYSLSSSVSAGRQIGEGIVEAKENLSATYQEKHPLIVELTYMEKCIVNGRISEEILLKEFAERSGIAEIKSFAEVYSACRTTGADMEKMIHKASQILMDKMEIKREIQNITSQKIWETVIISLLPVCIIVFLNIVSPDYMANIYNSFFGNCIMTLAAATIGLSYYLMYKILQIEM